MNKTSLASSIAVLAVAVLMISGTAIAQWDGGAATNNDDGGDDQTAYSDSTTGSDTDSSDESSSDSSDDSFSEYSGGSSTNTDSADRSSSSDEDSSTEETSAWDGGDAENNDDGTSTNREWDGDNSTNNDDGSGTTTEWNGENAENNDDGENTEWNGNNSTNDNDGGPGEETQWDGEDATNDDDGSNETDETDNSEENENDQNNDENNENTQTGSSSPPSDDTSYNIINVVDNGPELGFQLQPTSVNAGEPVEVTGNLNNTNETDVQVMLNERMVTETQADSSGQFQTTFTPEEVGSHTVTVRSSGRYEETQLEVTSTVDVDNISSRVRTNSPPTAIVCADIESQTTPEVKLVRDGATMATKTDNGRVCFNQELSEGTHDLTITAETQDSSDEASTTVNIKQQISASTTQDTTDSTPPKQDRGMLATVLQPLLDAFGSLMSMLSSMMPV